MFCSSFQFDTLFRLSMCSLYTDTQYGRPSLTSFAMNWHSFQLCMLELAIRWRSLQFVHICWNCSKDTNIKVNQRTKKTWKKLSHILKWLFIGIWVNSILCVTETSWSGNYWKIVCSRLFFYCLSYNWLWVKVEVIRWG